MNTTLDSEKLSLENTRICPLKFPWLMCLLIATGLLLVGGCKKSSEHPGVESPLNRALTKLNQSLQPPISPELQRGLSAMQYDIHESHYSEALTEADNLANASGLKDAEKKALDGVRGQLKVLASNPPAAAVPGQ